MKIFKSLFASIDCEVEASGVVDASGVEVCIAGAPTIPGGYLLIDNHLVPDAFVDRVANLFSSSRGFCYGPVITPREMVGDEFWETLDKKERRVVGHILLLLIEQGCIDVAYMHDPD